MSTITVRGWTYDPSAPTTTPINLHVYIDGRFSVPCPGNQSRSTWNAPLLRGGPVARLQRRGRRRRRASTRPASTRSTPATGLHQSAAGLPHADRARLPREPAAGRGGHRRPSRAPSPVKVSGWVIDPDLPPSPVRVHMYVDGRAVAATRPNIARTDIGLAYPRATRQPRLRVDRTAVAGDARGLRLRDQPRGGDRQPRHRLQDRHAGRAPGRPVRAGDPDAGQVQVEGWAIDPDTADPISVHVYVDGQCRQAALADETGPTWSRSRPGYGRRHGFDVTVPVLGGTRSICVYANNRSSGSGTPRLGCGTSSCPRRRSSPSATSTRSRRGGHHVTADGLGAGQGRPDRPRPGARLRRRRHEGVGHGQPAAGRHRHGVPGGRVSERTAGRPRRSPPTAAACTTSSAPTASHIARWFLRSRTSVVPVR